MENNMMNGAANPGAVPAQGAPVNPALVQAQTTQAAQEKPARKKLSFKDLMKKRLPDLPEILAGMRNVGRSNVGREINLVPDVKEEMIRTLKLRNFIFFICIVVAGASVAVTLVFGVIAGGQQAAVNSRKETLTALSETVNSYSDLSDFLTIKDQLGNLASIADNKNLLSRTFGILGALLPQGADTITLSELSINLSQDAPTISFDAQANANSEPYIDYNVLDSFKKSMQYMRYDYGNYVDKNGETIPAYCMVENAADGATFSDPEKGYYAFWLITGEGCALGEEMGEYTDDTERRLNENDEVVTVVTKSAWQKRIEAWGYTPETYGGQTVVRIWRTPQFNEWYGTNKMDLYGNITDVAHFESECSSYSGAHDGSDKLVWSTANESCWLVPDGVDGIRIADSSNGRGTGNELVLRFSATITLSPEVYSFKNKHMMAVAPNGRYNVTDSYVQVQNMFEERAADCAAGDTACNSAGGN